MLCMCVHQCMRTHSVSLLPFRTRRLELTPGRRLPQKVYCSACTSTLAPERWLIPRLHNHRGTAPTSLRAGFKHLHSIPLRTAVSYSSCSPEQPAFITLSSSRYTHVLAVLHHDGYPRTHVSGGAYVRLAGSTARDSSRIPDVLGKLASV